MEIKLVSSLAQCFYDTPMYTIPKLEQASMLRNERFCFQLAYKGEGCGEIRLESPLKDMISLRHVCHVECPMPVKLTTAQYARCDKSTPGLYPVRLEPMTENKLMGHPEKLQTLWIELEPNHLQAGNYEIKISVGEQSVCLTLDVIAADLPDSDFMYTRWFHTDCLASYYKCETWSEKHWEVIENFMRTAVRNGIDTILTPVFTLALDTKVGHERPTTQLVDITKDGDNYTFGFDRLDRWTALALRIGFKNFEISHLFSQWGAQHAPKIVATVNGKEEKIFGWDTDAHSDAYVSFLRQFLTAFLAHMQACGLDKRCFFHISDEPSLQHLETYRQNYKNIADLLDGYTIMDALSNYDFYKEGIVNRPFPSIGHSKTFIENNVPDLHIYYCGLPDWAISTAVTRGLATGLFKYDIKGFLHWGYNFYYSCYSIQQDLDPYKDNNGGLEYKWVPSGDTFSVFPAPDGSAYETIYLVSFFQMLQDLRAYQLCAQLHGKDFVLQLMTECCEDIILAQHYMRAHQITALREKINQAIKESLSCESN